MHALSPQFSDNAVPPGESLPLGGASDCASRKPPEVELALELELLVEELDPGTPLEEALGSPLLLAEELALSTPAANNPESLAPLHATTNTVPATTTAPTLDKRARISLIKLAHNFNNRAELSTSGLAPG